MNLSITITEQRPKYSRYVERDPGVEDVELVGISDAKGNARVVAGILRSIADEIDPTVTPVGTAVAFDGATS